MSIHQSMPMPGRSPRSAVDTCPQRRNRQTRLNPERLLIRAKLTGSARTHKKLTNSVPEGRSQIGGFSSWSSLSVTELKPDVRDPPEIEVQM